MKKIALLSVLSVLAIPAGAADFPSYAGFKNLLASSDMKTPAVSEGRAEYPADAVRAAVPGFINASISKTANAVVIKTDSNLEINARGNGERGVAAVRGSAGSYEARIINKQFSSRDVQINYMLYSGGGYFTGTADGKYFYGNIKLENKVYAITAGGVKMAVSPAFIKAQVPAGEAKIAAAVMALCGYFIQSGQMDFTVHDCPGNPVNPNPHLYPGYNPHCGHGGANPTNQYPNNDQPGSHGSPYPPAPGPHIYPN
ncbi:MAG: DUF3824 domain-containing protein [Elusimicrobiaceae bacterium]